MNDVTLQDFDNNSDVANEFTSAGFDRNSVLDLLEKDLNFLAATVIPEVFKLNFPQIHKEVWQLLKDYSNKPRSFFKLALGLPRGHAKTTLIKLFVVYCVFFTTRKFILIVAATSTMAENILSDIVEMLKSTNVRQIYGNWESSLNNNVGGKDTVNVKKFMFAGRSVVLAALGAGSSLRGLNIRNERPDVIICDDVQSAEDKDSKDVADKLLSWMLGTLFKSKSPSGCLYIYIGNMFSGPNCILAQLKKSSDWISFIVGALLSNGSSIWPELHSPEDLINELKHDMGMGKASIWFAEVQNDPDAGITSSFNVNDVPEYPFEREDLITGGCIIIDLSNEGVKSDAAAIGYFSIIETRNVFHDVASDKWSPLQMIQEAMKMGFKHNCPHIFVEATAYQASFLFWFNKICEENNISGFQLHPIFPKGKRKVARVLKFFTQMLDGSILLHPDVRAQVLSQAAQYKPSRRDNVDDILDLGGYLDMVLSDYGPSLTTAVHDLMDMMKDGNKTIEDCCTI